MELSDEEKELIKSSIILSIETFNQIPSKHLKRKNINKVLIINEYKELLKKF